MMAHVTSKGINYYEQLNLLIDTSRLMLFTGDLHAHYFHTLFLKQIIL